MFKICEHCKKKRTVLAGVLKRLEENRGQWLEFEDHGDNCFSYKNEGSAAVVIIPGFFFCQVWIDKKSYRFWPFFGASKIRRSLFLEKGDLDEVLIKIINERYSNIFSWT